MKKKKKKKKKQHRNEVDNPTPIKNYGTKRQKKN